MLNISSPMSHEGFGMGRVSPHDGIFSCPKKVSSPEALLGTHLIWVSWCTRLNTCRKDTKWIEY